MDFHSFQYDLNIEWQNVMYRKIKLSQTILKQIKCIYNSHSLWAGRDKSKFS